MSLIRRIPEFFNYAVTRTNLILQENENERQNCRRTIL